MTQAQMQQHIMDKIKTLNEDDLQIVIREIENLIESQRVWTPSAQESRLIEEALRSPRISQEDMDAVYRKYTAV